MGIATRARRCEGCYRKIIILADAKPGDGVMCAECEGKRRTLRRQWAMHSTPGAADPGAS